MFKKVLFPVLVFSVTACGGGVTNEEACELGYENICQTSSSSLSSSDENQSSSSEESSSSISSTSDLPDTQSSQSSQSSSQDPALSVVEPASFWDRTDVTEADRETQRQLAAQIAVELIEGFWPMSEEKSGIFYWHFITNRKGGTFDYTKHSIWASYRIFSVLDNCLKPTDVSGFNWTFNYPIPTNTQTPRGTKAFISTPDKNPERKLIVTFPSILNEFSSIDLVIKVDPYDNAIDNILLGGLTMTNGMIKDTSRFLAIELQTPLKIEPLAVCP